MMNFSCCHNCN